MPKWYKYLIIVGIVIFVICIVVDILWIEKASATMEIGARETRDPNAMRIMGACFAVAMYFPLVLGILAYISAGYGNFPILFFTGGAGTIGLLMALGFIG